MEGEFNMSETDTKKNFWTTGGMSFRLRLVLGILFLVALALVWAVNEGAPAAVIWVLPFLVMTYMMPTFLAVGRKHKALPAIFALNLFLGWSLLGWVATLVWSLTNPNPSAPVVINQAAGSMADELVKLADLRDKGILTEEEFQAKKAALLG